MKEIEKLIMHTPDLAVEKYLILKSLFPNAITETVDEEGTVVQSIDADILSQEINNKIVSGKEERYQFTWPGKKNSILLANSPISGTLRPSRQESSNFDSTENLYIEGDNLDVLKLIRETYLNRIKIIYIDPPYNTGKDFIYEDNFTEGTEEFLYRDGQYDNQGNRLTTNLDSNGRFHTDWLNMMYPRLRVARDLLSEEGIIFISIDDNEVENLKKICNEIFGERNFVGEIIRKTKSMTGDNGNGFNLQHENLFVFAKNKANVQLVGKEKNFDNYGNPDNDPNGDWCQGDPSAKSGGDTTYFPIKNPYTERIDYPPKGRYWAFSESTLEAYIQKGKIKFKETYREGERGFVFKRYRQEAKNISNPVNSLFAINNEFMNQSATTELKKMFTESIFNYPKPTSFIYELVKSSSFSDDDIILDFFSGSATTAHSVMKLNAEDGKRRKFIMIQVPELCDDKSPAHKAGYNNICDIGRERIIRAGKSIAKYINGSNQDIDIGFRVLRLDSSNIKNVYYSPEIYTQVGFDFEELTNIIKPDRTDEDLLFQVMLDLGIILSAKIEKVGEVYYVNENQLIACFSKVDMDLLKEIAQKNPYYVVFRDSSFQSDSTLVNIEQIFNTYSPSTIRRVL